MAIESSLIYLWKIVIFHSFLYVYTLIYLWKMVIFHPFGSWIYLLKTVILQFASCVSLPEIFHASDSPWRTSEWPPREAPQKDCGDIPVLGLKNPMVQRDFTFPIAIEVCLVGSPVKNALGELVLQLSAVPSGKHSQLALEAMAIESSLIFPWKMVIFHSYVSLPKGIFHHYIHT